MLHELFHRRRHPFTAIIHLAVYRCTFSHGHVMWTSLEALVSILLKGGVWLHGHDANR